MITRHNAYTGKTKWIDGYGGAREMRCVVNHGYIYRCSLCGIYFGNFNDASTHDKAHKQTRDARMDRVGGVEDESLRGKG